MTFGCFHLVGTVLPDSSTGETWEADEPSFVDGLEPCFDGRSAEGHMIVVDERWDGPDSDAIGSVERCSSLLLTGPPLNFAGVGCCMDIYHVQFGLFVKGTKKDGCTVCLNSIGCWSKHCGVRSMEEDGKVTCTCLLC